MKKYVRPQLCTLEVAVEGAVFAASVPVTGTTNNGFFTPQGTSTSDLGTSGSSSISSSRDASSLSPNGQSENEIYDDLVSFD